MTQIQICNRIYCIEYIYSVTYTQAYNALLVFQGHKFSQIPTICCHIILVTHGAWRMATIIITIIVIPIHVVKALHSFEDQAPVDEIYMWLIWKWVVVSWTKDKIAVPVTAHQCDITYIVTLCWITYCVQQWLQHLLKGTSFVGSGVQYHVKNLKTSEWKAVTRVLFW